MATNVGDLVARLRADLSQWETGCRDAEKTASKFSVNFSRILEAGIGFSVANLATQIASRVGGAVKELSKLGLEAKVQEDAFARLSQAAGQSANALIRNMQRASGDILNVSDAMSAASRAMIQGLDTRQITRLMEIARAQSKVVGIDVVDAFNRITESLSNLQVRGLKQLGIVIDVERAMKDFAAAHGRAAEELTELGKIQALYEATTKATKESVEALTTAHRTESESVQKLSAAWKQLQEDIGKNIPHGGLAESATGIIEILNDMGRAVDRLIGKFEGDRFQRALAWMNRWGLMGMTPPFEPLPPETLRRMTKGDTEREAARAESMQQREVAQGELPNIFQRGLFVEEPPGVAQFEGVLSLAEALREAAVANDAFARAGTEASAAMRSEAEAILDAESQALGLQDRIAELNAEGAALMELPAGWLPTGFEERTAKATAVMSDLAEQLRVIDAKAKVLGPDFDRVGARVAALQASIEAMLREGLEPTSDEVVRLQTELKGLEQFQSLKGMFQDIFGSVSGAISKAVEGVILGTQKMKDAFRNLGQYIIAEFAARVIKQALSPIVDWLAQIAAGIVQTILQAGAASAAGGAGGSATTGGAFGALLGAGGLAAIGAGAGALGGAGVISPSTAGMTGIFAGAAQLYGASGINATASLQAGRLVQNWDAPGLASMSGLGGAAGIIGGGLMFSGDPNVQRLGGAISSLQLLTIANPYIAAIGGLITVGTNLYSAIQGLADQYANQGAAIGNIAGTVAGAIIGTIIFPGVGTIIGAAIGGSAGGFLGGLFGRTGLPREVRDRMGAQKALQAASGFGGELAGAKNLQQLYGTITKYQSGYVGGTSAFAIPAYFPNVPVEQAQALVTAGKMQLPPGFESVAQYAQQKGYGQGPGGYQGVPVMPGQQNPYYMTFTGMQSFFDVMRENKDLMTVGIQAGVKPEHLTDANKKLRETIIAQVKFFDDLQREITTALDALLVDTVTPPSGETFSEALTREAEAFGEILVTLRQHSQENIDAARVELLTITDPRAFLDQVATIRGLIEDRYQGEIDLVQRWAGQMQQISAAWRQFTDALEAQQQALRLGGFGPTNPSERVAVVQQGFEEALAAFRAEPTITGGATVAALAEPFLQATSEQFTRPSAEFRAIFDQVQAALTEVGAVGAVRQAELDAALSTALAGRTIDQLVAENTDAMAADLSALLDETRALVTGMGWIFDPAYGQQQLTDAQVQIALLAQIAANTGRTGAGAAAAAPLPLGLVLDASGGIVSNPYGWERGPGGTWVPPTGFVGYQHGGAFEVGGAGGPDSQFVAFRATPGETVQISPPGETFGGVLVQVGDIHVTGAGDPEATARAVVEVLERRLRAPGRLRAVVQDVAKGAR